MPMKTLIPIDSLKLKSEFIRNGMTLTEVSKRCCISLSALCVALKRGSVGFATAELLDVKCGIPREKYAIDESSTQACNVQPDYSSSDFYDRLYDIIKRAVTDALNT